VWMVPFIISTSNQEIELRNQYTAETDHNKMVKNKTWKVIQQKANVTDKYAKDFSKAYEGMMNARYAGDDQVMFKWIKEANPNFSVEMYKDLSVAIESQSAEFLTVQTRLRDIKREHDNLRLKFPTSLVVGKRKELELFVIVSDRTTQDFKNKTDSDTNKLF
jgi:hypothetical protein